MPVNADPDAVRAVLFDMGGTLFDYSNRAAMRAPERRALQKMGLDPDSDDAKRAAAAARASVEAAFSRRPSFLHRDLFAARLTETAVALGVVPPAGVVDAFSRELQQAIVEALVPRPDAHAVLRALRARGFHVGLVSNADDDYLVDVLVHSGMDRALDAWTSSEEACSCKPDRGIFLLAASKADCSPRAAVFVGDSPQHDIAGAAAVGMRTVLIGDGDAPLAGLLPADRTPDVTIAELSELLDLPWCRGQVGP